ncbi:MULTISPECIES: Rieske (2Fe-2S) protein [Paenibacillus]|uniref:Rieske [2Fe-2S] domain-containing protein n=1 Tax=Paenibacillus naphthalenovorans TaxID=162209 RepID=A0A0U2UDX3_9BACL|nr:MULTISPECIES: Rieske (2Fe-2S) protein [Paenibacillus]ALS21420.1 Rieske [2Fe-2S] domain-containing protein [Paenibacillus naphthalenovorans]NTZ18408.1 Rieske (2Fe-2S) protein [Paenibacillus sp. JMULE4]GCL72680.1 Rieske (2Fe-2S) protein [Paenibacillus naphthalenovorans]SDJ54423.1 3-phenylpropionate/trans-cinnamate dioxygenase ferredoxin subunit [Paenibacillus naphthalenovorans]
MKHVAAEVGEIAVGTCKIISIEGRSIGIYYDGERYHAIRNVCPHEQAELCKGHFSGTTLTSKPHEYIYGMEGEILVCPWHGWEFNVKTGASLVDPDRYRVKVYDVSVEEDRIVVHV